MAWLEKLAEKFEALEQNLIPALQYIQSQERYLPPVAMQAVAKFLHIPESKVYGVASFYSQFYFEPRGRHIITICRGTACHVQGSGRIEGELSIHLEIPPGGTTGDKLFTLESVACVGSCALAPVVVVDDDVNGRQTVASCKKMVAKIRKQETVSE